MNNIILLATYWNEIDWLAPSLDQIDRIDPLETIICDGCFDPAYPLHSTDGTHQMLEQFVAARGNARLVSPVRYPFSAALSAIFLGHAHSQRYRRCTISRLRTVVSSSRLVAYRRNQALTFNHMISISRRWRPGRWCMTYDCDQFYPDAMIDNFSLVNEANNLGLLSGSELTFFADFRQFTSDYTARTYNNMPHRIYANTTVIPTRQLILERWLSRTLYCDSVPAQHIGSYFHYKLRSASRGEATYAVGDRRKPHIEAYTFTRLDGEHPSIIRRYFADASGSR